MKSIERRFIAKVQKYPDHSSFICFGRAVWGQKFTPRFISKYFNKLVEKADYDHSDRKDILKHFLSISEMPDGDIF